MKVFGLKAGGHLDRYVGSLFLTSYATAFLVVVGLFFILDMASNLDDFLEPWEDGTRAPTVILARYYVLNVPFLYMQSAPFVTLTGAMFTVSRLMKHNEVSAALSAGISAHRVLLPIFLGSLAVAVGMFGFREFATSSMAQQRDALLYVLKEKSYDRVYENLWLRDQAGARVRLGEFRPATGTPPRAEIRDLEVTYAAGDLITSVEADAATYVQRADGPAWSLEGGRRFDVGVEQEETNPEFLEYTQFTPSLALTFFRARHQPLDLSFSEVKTLASCDPDNVLYQTLLQYHLTFPLANVVLLLVGLPLMMRQERGKGVERLAFGLLLCVFFFGADFIFRNLGMQGSLQPLLASWIPVLFFGSLGIVLVDSMKT